MFTLAAHPSSHLNRVREENLGLLTMAKQFNLPLGTMTWLLLAFRTGRVKCNMCWRKH